MKPKVIKSSELISIKARLKVGMRSYLKGNGYPPTKNGEYLMGEHDTLGGDSYDYFTRTWSKIFLLEDLIEKARIL